MAEAGNSSFIGREMQLTNTFVEDVLSRSSNKKLTPTIDVLEAGVEKPARQTARQLQQPRLLPATTLFDDSSNYKCKMDKTE